MNDPDFLNTCLSFEKEIGFEKCYDVNKKEIKIGDRDGALYFISSLTDGETINKVLSFIIKASGDYDDMRSFACDNLISADISFISDIKTAAKGVLSGPSALIISGFSEIAVMDTRSLPGRSVAEPESDHVLKGSHDGFCESLNINVGLLRRRVRSENLRLEKLTVGRETKTDIALCYMEERVDKKFLKTLKDKINKIDVDALSLGQESLAECLVTKKWYNVFPKFRYTERPDAASAMIMEGSVIVICDTSPQAMILPCAIFDFIQESDDFYFPPLIGSYLRTVRVSVFIITLFLTPVWYLLIRNPGYIPSFLYFIADGDRGSLPILFQLLLVEFTIDALKLASLNTPSSLGNSLSVVAGLIIGDFAVETGWLSSDVILYMSFVAMANFTQPSYELGYAFKFSRIFLLIMIALADLWGLIAGTLIIIMTIAVNKSIEGSRGYLYPLKPWNRKAMKRQMIRVKLDNKEK